jgi:hypothetical protein
VFDDCKDIPHNFNLKNSLKGENIYLKIFLLLGLPFWVENTTYIYGVGGRIMLKLMLEK